jgi:DNA-binding NtrC family response regulator
LGVVSHLSARLVDGVAVSLDAIEAVARGAGSLLRARASFEARYIAEVLRQQQGNVSRAAKVLGLSRVMLQRKMKAYGLRSG